MYLFCCLSKSSKEKNGVVDVDEDIEKEPEEVSSERFAESGEGEEKNVEAKAKNTNEVTDTIDKCVNCSPESQSKLIAEEAQRSPSPDDIETTSLSSHTLTPMYPARVFLSEQGMVEGVLDECPAMKGVKRSNKSCDNVVVHLGNLFRRILPKWPITASGNLFRRILPKWPITASEKSDFGPSIDDKRQRRGWRQGFLRRGHARTRKNDADNRTDETKTFPESPEFCEIPLTSEEPPSPVICHKKPDIYPKKSSFPERSGDLKCGQGDAFRVPEYVMYGPPSPGKHLLQPQVLPVFSWSVPVFRTHLTGGGVSFTFRSASEQAGTSGTSSDTQPTTTTQVPTPIFISTTDTCPTQTPMEVDEPTRSDGSLLNHLVQLTNPSPIDNQQQLREDMQRQLNLQMQLQQQLIQQEVEARIRQMGAAPSEAATPDHVMFCEWTLVLRYPSHRKVADRPMGALGHEPLRKYELNRRRSSESQHISDSKGPDSQGPSSEPEPVPVCPQRDPVKTEPAPVCPEPAAPATTPRSGSEPGIPEATPEPEPVKSEPARSKPDSETARSDSLPTSPRSGSEPDDQQLEPVKSEPAPVGTVPEPPEKVEPKPESPESVACVKKPKPKKVTIKQEKLDDHYDVF